MREQFANNASSTLSAGINGVVTSLAVASAASFPTTGNFRILINDELLLVTAVSGTTFTVERGIEGTVAATHDGGDTVTHVLSAGGLQRFAQDNIPLFGIRPPLTLTDSTGAVIDSSDFTWVNQGSATATDNADGSITLFTPSIFSGNIRALTKAQPATPYEVKCGILPSYGGGFSTIKFGFRESATGKLVAIYLNNDASAGLIAQAQTFNSPTAFVGNVGSALVYNGTMNPFFAKITNDGTDLTFSVSGDGVFYFQVYTQTVGTFFTTAPDEVFWGLEMFVTNIDGGSITLCHWSEE